MQRRAAALYAVFFLVIAVGSYGAIAVAEEPSIHLDSGENYTANGTIPVGDRAYTVGNISSGAGGASTELTYTNESARLTQAIPNNSTVARYSNGSYRPLGEGETPPTGGSGGSSGSGGSGGTDGGSGSGIATGGGSTGNASGGETSGGNASGGGGNTNATGTASAGNTSASGNGSTSDSGGPGTRNESVSVYRAVAVNNSDNTTILSLTEEFNVTALLGQDSAVENTTLEANGTRYVRYTDNNTTVTVDSYLPNPQTRNFTQGDAFQYGSNNTTIASLTQEAATLQWTGTQTTTTEVEAGNVTLSDTQYVAHFPDNTTLTLSENVGAYQEEQAEIERFHDRVLGFWGIIILSLATAGLLVGMAYLPVRG